MLPEKFGHYLLLEPLGCGGMAEVYLARTVALSGFDKLLAIKRLLPSCSEDQHVIDLLADEARITVQLDHPNIVQVFDFGLIDGSYYLAMEYVDGVDLKALVEQSTGHPAGARVRQSGDKPACLPLEVALRITIAILDGLGFAHTCRDRDGQPLGIIHRDVTPHNVLISRHGQVKLSDFGVARARISNHVSQVGDVRGKFSYMPPEQVCGGEIDHRVDIFATGAILYELLAGKQPFRSANFSEQMRLLTREVPPPSQLAGPLPEALDRLTLKALHVDPAKRFDSAREFADALREQLEALSGDHAALAERTLAELVERCRDEGAEPEAPLGRLDRVFQGESRAADRADPRPSREHTDLMRRADYDGLSGASLISAQGRSERPRLFPRPKQVSAPTTTGQPAGIGHSVSGEIQSGTFDALPSIGSDGALKAAFTPTDKTAVLARTPHRLEEQTDGGRDDRTIVDLQVIASDVTLTSFAAIAPVPSDQAPATDPGPGRTRDAPAAATLHEEPTLVDHRDMLGDTVRASPKRTRLLLLTLVLVAALSGAATALVLAWSW